MLDAIGIYMAILTALWLKAGLQSGDLGSARAGRPDRRAVRLRLPADRPAVRRARACTPARGERPGMSRIVSSLAQVALVALVYAVASGSQFTSYYLFYGSLLFAVVYISLLRLDLREVDRRAAARGRLPAPRGARRQRPAHRGRRPRAARRRRTRPVNVVGFISLTPRPNNGLLSLGTLDELAEVIHRYRIDEVIIADPDFPQERAVELVDVAHGAGVRVRIAPSTMELLVHRAEFVPGEAVPLFELKPPVFEGFDYFVKRTFDLVRLAVPAGRCSARCSRWPRSPCGSARAGRSSTARCARGSAATPFACLKFRTMYRDADQRQADLESLNEATRRAVQDARRPAHDAGRALPAPLLARRAAAAVQRREAARCRSSARARCPSATSSGSRSGTRSATS